MIDHNMKPMKFLMPQHHSEKVREISKERQISIYRLLAFAVDNELQKEIPFEFDISLPEQESLEFTYAEQGGMILDFVKTLRLGAGLDILLLLRYKIGIPDKQEFLLAFTELLNNEMLEAFVPPVKVGQFPNPEGYYYYRAKGTGPAMSVKKTRNKGARYQQYLKLQKEFKNE